VNSVHKSISARQIRACFAEDDAETFEDGIVGHWCIAVEGEGVRRVAVRGVKLPEDPSARFRSAECEQECPKPSVSVHYAAERCEGAASLAAFIGASTEKNAIMLEKPFLL